MAPDPQISYISVFLVGLAVVLLLFFIYQFFAEGRDADKLENQAVENFLRQRASYGSTGLDLIDIGLVDQIWKMPANPPKAKGDALEHLTVRIYKGLDYNAWTVDELKSLGRNSPYDLTKLTGFDQGGDVIAEKSWFEETTNEKGEVEQIKRTKRVIIQCKAYAMFNDETSNAVVQATIAARAYYESLCGVKFDEAVIISTAPFLSKPAHDLAKHGKIHIVLQEQLKELVAKANWNVRRKSQQQEGNHTES